MQHGEEEKAIIDNKMTVAMKQTRKGLRGSLPETMYVKMTGLSGGANPREVPWESKWERIGNHRRLLTFSNGMGQD
jgi:hypothetical protein